MTDARLPGRWLVDIRFDRLSDRAFRTFASSLMYANEQGTDGRIERVAMRYLHPEGTVPGPIVQELISAGLWTVLDGGAVQVADWSATQSTAAQVAEQREKSKLRQRKHRSATKEPPDPKSSRVTAPVTHGATNAVSRTRTKDKDQGQDQDEVSVAPINSTNGLRSPIPFDATSISARAAASNVDFPKVQAALTERAEDSVSAEATWTFIRAVLDNHTPKAAGRTNYLLATIRNDWARYAPLVLAIAS